MSVQERRLNFRMKSGLRTLFFKKIILYVERLGKIMEIPVNTNEENEEISKKIKTLDDYRKCTSNYDKYYRSLKDYRDRKDFVLGDLYLFSEERRIPVFCYPSLKEIEKIENSEKDKDKEEKIKKLLNIPFDPNSGNVHMIPSEIELAELCSEYIEKKWMELRECINKKKEKDEKYKDHKDKIKVKKISDNFLSETYYKKAKYLFSYIRISYRHTKNDYYTNYDLVFNRFFIDGSGSKRVNCILLCFQIEIFDVPKESNITGSKIRDEAPYTKNYPHKSKNGAWSEDEKKNKVYYNLGVDIRSDEKEIAKAFLDFVLEQETGKQETNKGEQTE